jgi:GNAT superfamily N-acetyltransferase
MSLKITSLVAAHLDAAAKLVAERYRSERRQSPLLPAPYMDAGAIAPRLLPHIGHVPGVAALEGGRLVGFVMSLLVSNRGERMAYVPDFGHGAIGGQEYGLYRQMYAEIADRWLANGCFFHGITLYPHEEAAREAWFSLGFGLAVMDALRSVEAGTPSTRLKASGVTVRRAGLEEIELIAALERGLGRHLSASPAYLPMIQGRRSELEGWLEDAKHVLWLAFREGEAVGYMRFEPSEGLVLPTAAQTTVSITGAFTRQDARGSGIGSLLLQTGLEWAGQLEYTRCSVDFETANLIGSNFWLKQFRPVTHSVVRRVSPQLGWAHAGRDEADLERAFEGHTWIG